MSNVVNRQSQSTIIYPPPCWQFPVLPSYSWLLCQLDKINYLSCCTCLCNRL